MSLNRTWKEYHLTPCGWVEGSYCDDPAAGQITRLAPEGRVLTISYYEEMTLDYTNVFNVTTYDRIEWKSEDDAAIKRLTDIFGDRPRCDWFKPMGG